jgi:hypothetical protein
MCYNMKRLLKMLFWRVKMLYASLNFAGSFLLKIWAPSDLSIGCEGETSPRRGKMCLCHCIQARYKKAQKRFEATFGNKKCRSSNRVLSAGDRWQAHSQRSTYTSVSVWEREREKCCRLRFCHANRYSNWWLLQIDASEFRQAWINERAGEISRTLFVWVLRRPRYVCSMHAYISAHTASARTYRIKRGAGGAVHRRSCHFPHLINARPNNQSCALRNVNCGHTRVVLKCNTCAPVRSPANVN